MAELVDATDLKSVVPKGMSRFDSGRPHQSQWGNAWSARLFVLRARSRPSNCNCEPPANCVRPKERKRRPIPAAAYVDHRGTITRRSLASTTSDRHCPNRKLNR